MERSRPAPTDTVTFAAAASRRDRAAFDRYLAVDWSAKSTPARGKDSIWIGVFKRDVRSSFEQIRKSLRQRLGVLEAAIDDGWTIWMRLRDALTSNHVVNLQGDRVMPGQKGQAVPFCHGHLLLPTGPIKLALASGAPDVRGSAIHINPTKAAIRPARPASR